jgi:predicted CoA-binding protein
MSIEEDILNSCKVIAIVGLSSDPDRPSNRVASYLKGEGFRIIPVNPNEKEVLGEICYPNLLSVIEPVDVVDIFRRPGEVSPVVDEAIKIKAKAVWMQEGIVNEASAAKARQAGLKVVMDKCMKIEHRRTKWEKET